MKTWIGAVLLASLAGGVALIRGAEVRATRFEENTTHHARDVARDWRQREWSHGHSRARLGAASLGRYYSVFRAPQRTVHTTRVHRTHSRSVEDL